MGVPHLGHVVWPFCSPTTDVVGAGGGVDCVGPFAHGDKTGSSHSLRSSGFTGAAGRGWAGIGGAGVSFWPGAGAAGRDAALGAGTALGAGGSTGIQP